MNRYIKNKKMLLMSFLFVTVFIFSCANNSNEDEKFIGNWKRTTKYGAFDVTFDFKSDKTATMVIKGSFSSTSKFTKWETDNKNKKLTWTESGGKIYKADYEFISSSKLKLSNSNPTLHAMDAEFEKQ